MTVSIIDRFRATIRSLVVKSVILISAVALGHLCNFTDVYAQDIGQEIDSVPMSGISDTIVFDPNTGLALFGYDPVAYFSDGQAVLGQAQFESQMAGLVWRFKNQGNQLAFLADPTVYIPQFGGYDGVSITKGQIVDGNPTIFLTLGNALYLFRSIEHRKLFEDSETLQVETAQKWPSVKSRLVKSH